jgi:predicted transcriptional regulator of viral defense system
LSIALNKASSLALAKYERPVVTDYRLGIVVFHLVQAGGIDGQSLRLTLNRPDRRHYRQALNFLLEYGVLASVRGLASERAFTILGRSSVSATEVACTVDPFAYVSHLSAMELHGLTDRVSQTLYLSSPDPKEWRQFADKEMHKDLEANFGDYVEAGFPILQRTRMERVFGQTVHTSHSVHLGAFRKTAESEVRVATIGRTFLDMLREPALCGGIHHVLGIYRTHAAQYLGLIADEVSQHGKPIDKVRAGYVLEEQCKLQHPSFAEWQKFAARGGSRRLVAANEYAPTYSERWALSLNAGEHGSFRQRD